MQNFTEPSMPINISVNMPGKSFNEKAKNAKILLYIMIPLFCIAGISTMVLGSMSRSIFCKYKGNAAYDCSIATKNILMGNSITNYSDIRAAVLASKRGSKSTVYQIKLVNGEGNQLSYTNTWQSPASSLTKIVEKLNGYFRSDADFSYDFAIDWVLILMGLPFIFIPFIILAVFKYYTNNYIFEKVRPGYYKAVLKAKGIGKMNLTDEQVTAFMHQVREGQVTNEQIYEESWNQKDQAFKDRDVEDLTKQFYEDGK